MTIVVSFKYKVAKQDSPCIYNQASEHVISYSAGILETDSCVETDAILNRHTDGQTDRHAAIQIEE